MSYGDPERREFNGAQFVSELTGIAAAMLWVVMGFTKEFVLALPAGIATVVALTTFGFALGNVKTRY